MTRIGSARAFAAASLRAVGRPSAPQRSPRNIGASEVLSCVYEVRKKRPLLRVWAFSRSSAPPAMARMAARTRVGASARRGTLVQALREKSTRPCATSGASVTLAASAVAAPVVAWELLGAAAPDAAGAVAEALRGWEPFERTS